MHASLTNERLLNVSTDVRHKHREVKVENVPDLHRRRHCLLKIGRRPHTTRQRRSNSLLRSRDPAEMEQVRVFHHSIKYLGHIVRPRRLEIDSSMTKKLWKARLLQAIMQLRSFLGLLSRGREQSTSNGGILVAPTQPCGKKLFGHRKGVPRLSLVGEDVTSLPAGQRIRCVHRPRSMKIATLYHRPIGHVHI